MVLAAYCSSKDDQNELQHPDSCGAGIIHINVRRNQRRTFHDPAASPPVIS